MGAVAFFVVAERKLLGAIQRRVGPSNVGFWGLLQAVADGFKLINKEIIWPSKSNKYLYFLAPVLTLFLSWVGWLYIPFTWQSAYIDDPYSSLIILSVSSLNVYGVIIAGWASNSKYAFLGALRASAQMISYEIIISISLIPVFFLSNSLNLVDIVRAQHQVWFIFVLAPLALLFYIAIVAETNRAPFDLPEAEGELVAGFNLEYGSMIFSFFFLAEYGNIILMNAFFSLLFLGGWLMPFYNDLSYHALLEIFCFTLKIIITCCVFIWIRSILPRYRYDQLMYICWKKFLPFAFSYTIFFIFIYLYLGAAPISRHVEFEVLYEFLYSDYSLLTLPPIFLKSFKFFKRWVWDFGNHKIVKRWDSFWYRSFKSFTWVHFFSGSLAFLLKILGFSNVLIGLICTFYASRFFWVTCVDCKRVYFKIKNTWYGLLTIILFCIFLYVTYSFIILLIIFIKSSV